MSYYKEGYTFGGVAFFFYVFPYVLAGVGIGAFLHNWVPQEWILAVLGGNVFIGYFFNMVW